jgi:hypothetical protein
MRSSVDCGQAPKLSGGGGLRYLVTVLSSYLLGRARGPIQRVVALGCCIGPRWRVVAGNISAEVDPHRMLAAGSWQVLSESVAKIRRRRVCTAPWWVGSAPATQRRLRTRTVGGRLNFASSLVDPVSAPLGALWAAIPGRWLPGHRLGRWFPRLPGCSSPGPAESTVVAGLGCGEGAAAYVESWDNRLPAAASLPVPSDWSWQSSQRSAASPPWRPSQSAYTENH